MTQAQVTAAFNALLAQLPANYSDYARLANAIHQGDDILNMAILEMQNVVMDQTHQDPPADNQQVLDQTALTDWAPQ